MKVLIVVTALLAVASAADTCKRTAKSTVVGSDKTYCYGELIFEDNFDKLNFKTWQHENTLAGGGNWEFQWYTNNRSNSFINDGKLVIKPTLTADHMGEAAISSATLDLNGGAPADECTNAAFYGCIRAGSPNNILNPIKSARLRSLESVAFTYGRVEVRAKMPAGDWLWPAIWMMPKYNEYGGWPTSGEIDIMESRGNRELRDGSGVNIGVEQVGSTLHWGPDFWHNGWERTHWSKNNNAGYHTDFHVYELEWTDSYISFAIDGVQTGRIAPPAGGFWELGAFESSGLANPWKSGSKMAPFDQPYYLIINLAAGGTNFFPDNASNPGGKPWSNESPQAATDFWNGRGNWLNTWNGNNNEDSLQIDYVKVYAV